MGAEATQLVEVYPRLDGMMAQVEARIRDTWGEEESFLAGAAREALTGRGKRLRPMLLLLSAECAGGVTENSLAMAAVVEVVHAASLVHDDVIDDAPARRGRRSAKVAWGNKLSVLLGDYLLARAFSLTPAEERQALVGELSVVAAQMCIGQVEELHAVGRRIGEDEYLEIVRAKTGALFGYCCRTGARTGSGPAEMGEALGRFGERFGVAFQLADDILDLTGTNGRSGKPEARDLAEGKWTLPLIEAYRRGDEMARARLEGVLEGRGVSAREVELAREIAGATGAVEAAWGRVAEWLESARRELRAIPDSPAKRALLATAGERFPMPVMTGRP